MNLNDLKNFDVKNINVEFLKENFVRKPENAVKALLILVSFLFMFNIFSAKQKEARELKTKITEMEDKMESINNYQKDLKELNHYIESLSAGIPDYEIIDKLSDFAEKRNIHILSFSPAKSENEKFYRRTMIDLNISAGSYKDLALFIYDIESSPFNLRVDQWTGQLATDLESISSDQAAKQETKKQSIQVQVQIGAINFKK